MSKIEELKNRIAAASVSLYMEKGYRDTSLRMIGQMSNISHTQVLYHFKSKASLGGLVISSYFRKLFQVVEEQINRNGKNKFLDNKLYWWTLHYLILTRYESFARFYMEFATDEADTFVDITGHVGAIVFPVMFDMDVDLLDSSMLTDLYIITGIDMIMAKLCVEKSLKVSEAIQKLFHLDVMEGFGEKLTVEEIEDFIEDKNLIDIVESFNATKLAI